MLAPGFRGLSHGQLGPSLLDCSEAEISRWIDKAEKSCPFQGNQEVERKGELQGRGQGPDVTPRAHSYDPRSSARCHLLFPSPSIMTSKYVPTSVLKCA